MSDAGRAYEHYRWAKRYSKRGMIEKAHAHMARAMHYGHSDIVARIDPVTVVISALVDPRRRLLLAVILLCG